MLAEKPGRPESSSSFNPLTPIALLTRKATWASRQVRRATVEVRTLRQPPVAGQEDIGLVANGGRQVERIEGAQPPAGAELRAVLDQVRGDFADAQEGEHPVVESQRVLSIRSERLGAGTRAAGPSAT